MQLNQAWQQCLATLEDELPAQQYTTWISSLQLQSTEQTQCIHLLAPNRFIKDWVNDKFLSRIEALMSLYTEQVVSSVNVIDTQQATTPTSFTKHAQHREAQASESVPSFAESSPPLESNQGVINASANHPTLNKSVNKPIKKQSAPQDVIDFISGPDITDDEAVLLDTPSAQNQVSVDAQTIAANNSVIRELNFDTFVEGKSNQLARAAAMQVADNPGGSYNPLFLYGGVGLGKTHLMHAVGNELLKRKPNAKVVYLHSERFVADMVKALQLNAINEFKRYYRSVDALLIDDIQFFAGKERSQEEFFHTFNALLQEDKQIILTCDKYPREIKGLEERLKSRFGWGLTVAVEPPELETRVAILLQKAQQSSVDLPEDAAFFIAQRLRSNVRELEGALKRVTAQADFKGKPIDIPLIKDSLKDLLSLQDRLVSIDNIQKTVAEYYKIKVSDLHSKRRSRSVARPRQVAMALAKELTSHSLPEIGDAFGGRDHTTVLHACRKIEELKQTTTDMQEDIKNLLRILTT